jgi:hypothetical protein
LKPHAIFIVPFLMCRRRYRALAGSVLSIALLAALQYVVLTALTRDYVENVLPRMSENSSVSSMEFLASGKTYSSVEYEDLVSPKWNTPVLRSGQEYLRQGFNGALSSSNASLAKFLWLNSSLLTYFGQAPLSVCIYLAFLAIVCVAVWLPAGIQWNEEKTFAFCGAQGASRPAPLRLRRRSRRARQSANALPLTPLRSRMSSR